MFFRRLQAGKDGLFTMLAGQRVSSTRAEGCAALLAMLLPVPARLAIDNSAAVRRLRNIVAGVPSPRPWGLMKDGDLWSRVECCARQRGLHSLAVEKVIGHATSQQVQAGQADAIHKFGNEQADELAKAGARQHGDGLKLVQAALAAEKAYVRVVHTVHSVMLAVFQHAS
eukprot:12842309-Alexandrium_andersonii.AAC.1